MKKNEVIVGGVYTAKVSNRVVKIRIDSVHSRQGWCATNTQTGKRIHIKSPQRLRSRVEPAGQKPKPNPTVEIVAGQPIPPAKPAKMKGDGQPKRLSALNAAAQVLKESGQPMKAKELINEMAKRSLWSSPNGKTPEATLYAAMLREIKAKGAAARFRKVDRGQFAAN